MLIDTHAHLASARFEGESERIVEQAGKDGIDRILSISTDLEDAPKNIALSEKFPNVYISVGIHPTSVHEIEDPEWLSKLKAWATHPKVVAIGECGLDFFTPAKRRAAGGLGGASGTFPAPSDRFGFGIGPALSGAHAIQPHRNDANPL
ncbi:MAG: TatD family hydrolase [Verrucomicrobiales bacterium]